MKITITTAEINMVVEVQTPQHTDEIINVVKHTVDNATKLQSNVQR